METTITKRFNILKQKATEQALSITNNKNKFPREAVSNAEKFLNGNLTDPRFSSRNFSDELQNLVYLNSFIDLNEQTGLFDLT